MAHAFIQVFCFISFLALSDIPVSVTGSCDLHLPTRHCRTSVIGVTGCHGIARAAGPTCTRIACWLRARGICCEKSVTIPKCLRICNVTIVDGNQKAACKLACPHKTTPSLCVSTPGTTTTTRRQRSSTPWNTGNNSFSSGTTVYHTTEASHMHSQISSTSALYLHSTAVKPSSASLRATTVLATTLDAKSTPTTSIHDCHVPMRSQPLQICELSDWMPWNCTGCRACSSASQLLAKRSKAICCLQPTMQDIVQCLASCGVNRSRMVEYQQCSIACPHYATFSSCVPTTTPPSLVTSVRSTAPRATSEHTSFVSGQRLGEKTTSLHFTLTHGMKLSFNTSSGSTVYPTTVASHMNTQISTPGASYTHSTAVKPSSAPVPSTTTFATTHDAKSSSTVSTPLCDAPQPIHLCELSDWMPWDCTGCRACGSASQLLAKRVKAICCRPDTKDIDHCLASCGINRSRSEELQQCTEACPQYAASSTCVPNTTPQSLGVRVSSNTPRPSTTQTSSVSDPHGRAPLTYFNGDKGKALSSNSPPRIWKTNPMSSTKTTSIDMPSKIQMPSAGNSNISRTNSSGNATGLTISHAHLSADSSSSFADGPSWCYIVKWRLNNGRIHHICLIIIICSTVVLAMIVLWVVYRIAKWYKQRKSQVGPSMYRKSQVGAWIHRKHTDSVW